MNAATIEQLAKAALNGSMPSPEIVGGLIEEEVEYNLVDYRALRFTFYGASGGVVLAPLQIERLPEVSKSLDITSLRAAIHDSQSRGQKFRDFSSRAMRAGVQSYYAFLRGKRVLYVGRRGDQHVWLAYAGERSGKGGRRRPVGIAEQLASGDPTVLCMTLTEGPPPVTVRVTLEEEEAVKVAAFERAHAEFEAMAQATMKEQLRSRINSVVAFLAASEGVPLYVRFVGD